MPDPRGGFQSPLIHQQLKSSGVAQVIVVMKSPATLASAGRGLVAMRSRFTRSDLSPTRALAEASAGGGAARVGARARAGPLQAQAARVYPNLGVMYGTVDEAGLAALRADARIASVTGAPELSLIRPTAVRAATPPTGPTWGIGALGVEALWDQGFSGRGVRVAHLDTGVDGKHPALKKAIAAFAQFDDFGREVKPSPKPFDSDEHGTHTAATIAGRPVRGRIVGVAPGAELASALVIEGGDAVARVLGGLDWALTQGVKVLSMSLGFRGWWEDFLPIIQILRSRGVLPVIAVGNEGAGRSRSPGNYAEALSIGAIDERSQVASFSSSQRFARRRDPNVPDLVAPGVDVSSAKPGGGFQSMDGTSMATPHVAGLAALLLEARPGASASDVETAILRSCKVPRGQQPARCGHGIPDAAEALRLLTQMTYAPAAPTTRRPRTGKARPKR